MPNPHKNKIVLFFQTYSSSQKREAKLARILVTLVFCFLFCNLGKIVLSIYDLGNSGKVILLHL